MAEERMNKAVNSMVDDLDRNVLRGLQKDGYVCSAKCFDNKEWSSEQLQACVERCQMPMQQVQQYLQSEMQSFQNRLQRCAMDCQDRARDSLPADGNVDDSRMNDVQNQMNNCIGKCVESHIALLPKLQKRIEDAVRQSQKPQL